MPAASIRLMFRLIGRPLVPHQPLCFRSFAHLFHSLALVSSIFVSRPVNIDAGIITCLNKSREHPSFIQCMKTWLGFVYRSWLNPASPPLRLLNELACLLPRMPRCHPVCVHFSIHFLTLLPSRGHGGGYSLSHLSSSCLSLEKMQTSDHSRSCSHLERKSIPVNCGRRAENPFNCASRRLY